MIWRKAALLNMIITGTGPFASRGVTSVISMSTLMDGCGVVHMSNQMLLNHRESTGLRIAYALDDPGHLSSPWCM